MMKEPIDVTENRTGILTSPDMAKEMIEHTVELSPPGGAEDLPLDEVRASFVLDAEPAGTMPPPVADGVESEPRTRSMAVLIDALGARLAFERTGTRLYEALITKVRTLPPVDGGPSDEDLSEIWTDELGHFQLLHDTIMRLGGDPTAVTPTANLEGVAGMGPLQIVTEPRFGVIESMHASLIAELSDRDSWDLLIRLAEAAGQTDLIEAFSICLAAEERHVARVRGWLTAMKERQAAGGAPAPTP